MSPLSDNTPKNQMNFMEGALERVHDFLEDAVVHLQLRHFTLAAESLRDASQMMNFVERYVLNVTEAIPSGNTEPMSAPLVSVSTH